MKPDQTTKKNASNANGSSPMHSKPSKLTMVIVMTFILIAGASGLDPSIVAMIFHAGMFMA